METKAIGVDSAASVYFVNTVRSDRVHVLLERYPAPTDIPHLFW